MDSYTDRLRELLGEVDGGVCPPANGSRRLVEQLTRDGYRALSRCGLLDETPEQRRRSSARTAGYGFSVGAELVYQLTIDDTHGQEAADLCALWAVRATQPDDERISGTGLFPFPFQMNLREGVSPESVVRLATDIVELFGIADDLVVRDGDGPPAPDVALTVKRLASKFEMTVRSHAAMLRSPRRFRRCLREWLGARLTPSVERAPAAPTGTSIDDGISRGLRFIGGRQATDGHFPSDVSLTPSMCDSHEERSVYVHAYILQALTSVYGQMPLIEDLVGRAAEYLRSAQEKSGWWKFYGPDRVDPPDDADDTSVAFAALLSATRPFNRRLTEEANEWLETLTRVRSESGLYKTWADASWNEESFDLPDVVVNANILFLQSMVGRPDSRVMEYLARAIQTETYHVLNLFAVSTILVPYLISRCNQYGVAPAFHAPMDGLGRYMAGRQQSDGGWGDDLDSALALLTLLNAGDPGAAADRAAEYLLRRQQPDGGWESRPLFRDMHPRYYGSRSLTTALCVEALSRLNVLGS
ncbi:MAG: prenyltransferase/squalene oxidase repeat-containing protein [Gemmatimonadota bacterium]